MQSLFQQRNLAARIGPSMYGFPGGQGALDISASVTGYEHQRGARWGNLSARIDFNLPMSDLLSWVNTGLGHDVQVTTAGGVMVWEGFVNAAEIRLGGITITVGPLVDVSNRVGVNFTLEDTETDPPIEGIAMDTTLVDDVESINRFGIWEKWFDGGTRPIEDAEKLRDTILDAKSWPGAMKSYNAAEAPAITINCLGYYAWFNAFYYYWTSDITDDQFSCTLTQKVNFIADQDTNHIFSLDRSRILYNGWLANRYEQERKTAATLLEDIMALGDANDIPWFVTIEHGRIISYKPMPQSIDYFTRISGADGYSLSGQVPIDPWMLEAGRWVMATDIFTGDPLPINYKQMTKDVRLTFIDTLTYTMPYDIQFNGMAVGRLPQYLAKLGLGNM